MREFICVNILKQKALCFVGQPVNPDQNRTHAVLAHTVIYGAKYHICWNNKQIPMNNGQVCIKCLTPLIGRF